MLLSFYSLSLFFPHLNPLFHPSSPLVHLCSLVFMRTGAVIKQKSKYKKQTGLRQTAERVFLLGLNSFENTLFFLFLIYTLIRFSFYKYFISFFHYFILRSPQSPLSCVYLHCNPLALLHLVFLLLRLGNACSHFPRPLPLPF